MAIIKRNRTLRPSSREPQSTYKIDTSKVGIDDTLYVTITHEDNAEFKEVYIFEGKDLVDKNSIHFSYQDERIEWLDNLIYNKADTIYKKEENNDITPIIKRKTTKKEKKSFRCPYCGSENKLQEEQIKSRYLNCGWCNNTVENPFYKKTIMDLAKDNWWKIAITIFIFTLYIIGANTDPNSISTPIENSEWDGSVAQVKQYLKRNLKDPDSYEGIEWSKVTKVGNQYKVRHKYRAKNSFGGYVIEEFIFTLNEDGNVISKKNLLD